MRLAVFQVAYLCVESSVGGRLIKSAADQIPFYVVDKWHLQSVNLEVEAARRISCPPIST